ncbi:MAG TPA: histidine phosphatase family protein [Patescibacteria group bacterium]|nr:histidine phosphatase family protein [Patescibacteria group bacterium]
MLTIIFEAHGTSLDNENKVASGWSDSRLSPLGMDQAKQIGDRYRDKHVDAVFCSDLKRSQQSGVIAFDANPKLIFTDWRLRECDYGDLTQEPSQSIDAVRVQHIVEPFPNGESYNQCMERIASFLNDMKVRYEGKTIMIIGHRATQYGLEHWLNNKPLEQIIAEPWSWQPGWTYKLGA